MGFNFEELFKIPIFFMKFTGSHPEIRRDMKWFTRFMFMHGSLIVCFFLLVYNVTLHDAKNKDWVEVCTKGVFVIFSVVVTFTYGIMLKYQHILNNVIQKIKEDYIFAEQLPLEEQNLLMQYIRKGLWVAKFWFFISILTAILFPCKAIALMVYYKLNDRFDLVQVVQKMSYPEPVESIKNELPMYIGFFVLYSWFALYAAMIYAGEVPMVPIFMLHACGQLELLKLRVDEIFYDEIYNPVVGRNKLKYVVQKLDDVYSFVEQIEMTFLYLFELTLKGSTICLPIASFMLIQTMKNGVITVEFIMIIFGVISFTATPCYYGDVLIQASVKFREAIYMSGWEKHWDKDSRVFIFMILLQTERPVAVHSTFKTICLTTMADVFQQAFTILNVLNASLSSR